MNFHTVRILPPDPKGFLNAFRVFRPYPTLRMGKRAPSSNLFFRKTAPTASFLQDATNRGGA